MEILILIILNLLNILYGLLIGEFLNQEFLVNGQVMFIGSIQMLDQLVELVEE